jgi:DNA-binding response OmpR family regulator
VHRLRKLLTAANASITVVTIRGIGYLLDDAAAGAPTHG